MKSAKESSIDWKEDWNRAKDFLKAAENNLRFEDYKTAANRIYFTAERAIVAALKFNSNPAPKNHKIIWTNSKLLDIEIDTYNLLRNLYDMRLQADYGSISDIIALDKENLDKYIAQVKELLNIIKNKYKFD